MDFSNLMSLINGISQLANVGFGFRNMFNRPSAPPQSAMPAFDPSQYQPPSFSIQMPDFSELFASMQDAAKPDRTPMLKNLASSAAQMRKSMQGQGVYSGGAVTPEALASLMQLDNPSDLTEAWKLYGDQYGLGPLPGNGSNGVSGLS